MQLKSQSDRDQFVFTEEAERYYQNSNLIPICQVCSKKVAYDEWNLKFVEFACHGNILRFYFQEGVLARVEELND
ncbi:hypothetical protein NUH30_18815 [Leptospira sp. 85282-16]|uniref:hypothetical protein n=1 Tax=Leptospira sp. 85282-16 TaxID=2971256 RepID=UPI0021BE2BB9|nr:hypothetical protein [Leptospira sp. 85282-16]MCT8335745.1 hypothetical protein [Leptospira sp. 85282-16]